MCQKRQRTRLIENRHPAPTAFRCDAGISSIQFRTFPERYRRSKIGIIAHIWGSSEFPFLIFFFKTTVDVLKKEMPI